MVVLSLSSGCTKLLVFAALWHSFALRDLASFGQRFESRDIEDQSGGESAKSLLMAESSTNRKNQGNTSPLVPGNLGFCVGKIFGGI